jgi:hypothetical protein
MSKRPAPPMTSAAAFDETSGNREQDFLSLFVVLDPSKALFVVDGKVGKSHLAWLVSAASRASRHSRRLCR